MGLENGISYFAESLFSVRLRTEDYSAAALSAYWIGMTVSRMVCSALMRHPKRTLVAYFAASAASLLVLAVSASPILSLCACFAAGWSYGPIWSTLMSQATARFPHASAGAAGVMSAGVGVGGLVAPVVMGFVCDCAGIATGFWMLAAMAAGGMTLCALLRER